MELKRIETSSIDGTKINLQALYNIAPSCFTEVTDNGTQLYNDTTNTTAPTIDVMKEGTKVRMAINFQTLRQLLGDNAVDDNEEMFQFTWPGKQKARWQAATPIDDTLRPVKEESLDWDNTQNLYIEGDNLAVLKLLQRGYMGKVKMIYIDPPYNTGNDFVYEDNFAHSQAQEDFAAGNTDELGNRYRKNTNSNGRFHSDWCSMMYSRLLVARSLLAEDGVIFISIDDNEVQNLRKICDEVMGEGNFLAQVVWERAYAPINLMKHFSPSHDYILCYAKNQDLAQCNGIQRSAEADARYTNPDNDPRGVWQSDNLSVGPAIESNIYTITTPSGREVEPPAGRSWSLSRNAFRERLEDNRIWFGSDGDGVPRLKRFLSELRKTGVTPMTIWKYTEVGHSQSATQALADIFDGQKYFDYPKPVELIKRVISLYTTPNSLILDFFSGSATTAHAVMQLNAEDGGHRRYICVQLPEETPEKSEARKAGYKTIPDIAKERIRRAGKMILEELEEQNKTKKPTGEATLNFDNPDQPNDANTSPTVPTLDTGFRVFRLDSTNYQDVYRSPSDYDQDQLDLFASNIKPDRTDLDLLFGAMLSWGVQLSTPMQTEEIEGCKVYTVDENALVACFDTKLTEGVITAIANKKPVRLLFSDACFDEDKTKINTLEMLRQKLGWNEKEVVQNIRVI